MPTSVHPAPGMAAAMQLPTFEQAPVALLPSVHTGDALLDAEATQRVLSEPASCLLLLLLLLLLPFWPPGRGVVPWLPTPIH